MEPMLLCETDTQPKTSKLMASKQLEANSSTVVFNFSQHFLSSVRQKKEAVQIIPNGRLKLQNKLILVDAYFQPNRYCTALS